MKKGNRTSRFVLILFLIIIIPIIINNLSNLNNHSRINTLYKIGLLKKLESKTMDAFVNTDKWGKLTKSNKLSYAEVIFNAIQIENSKAIIARIRNYNNKKVLAVYTSKTDELVYP